MKFREAEFKDIPGMQVVRNSVRENALSDPSLIQDSDYVPYLGEKGKGWVCEINDEIAGFAIVDLHGGNIWALFVHPGHEKKGIGKRLHWLMLEWYFITTPGTVWLSTAPGTRAEQFYRKAGWKETGTYGKGEIKFEMRHDEWKNLKIINHKTQRD